MTPTIEELHVRIMEIEQYLLEQAEEKSTVPWFSSDRVTYNGYWQVIK